METIKFVASLGLAWTLFVLTILGIMYFNWWRKHTEDDEPTDSDHLDGVEVDPKTVGQFTGLRDKNGKEIYEGDYFQVAKNKIYTVKWLDIGESDFETYAATFILWLNDETFFPFDEFAIKHGEVISNIYESPKLPNPWPQPYL